MSASRAVNRITKPMDQPAQAWSGHVEKIVPRFAQGCGRGLFAAAAIAPGELLERACSSPITPEQCVALDAMRPVGDYYFAHPENPEAGLMFFGLMSMANHSDAPNAEVRRVFSPELGWLGELTALVAIPAGAEITHRYRCPPWFELA